MFERRSVPSLVSESDSVVLVWQGFGRGALTLLCCWLVACSGKSLSENEVLSQGGQAGSAGSAGAPTNGGSVAYGGANSAGDSAVGGSAAACTRALDCPAPPSACVVATCTDGVCGTDNAVQGAFVARDDPADCLDTVCDGSGRTMTAPDPDNVPESKLPCVRNTCDGAGNVVAAPSLAGAVCGADGGQRCDGMGQCVTCLADSDCPIGQSCAGGECMVASCSDGVRDGSETDVDCGGSCSACSIGMSCELASDCSTNVCGANSARCQDSTCHDGRKNGSETDVDCGGSCSPCAVTQDCYANADCQSQACDQWAPHRCLASHCLDHRFDADETSTDCGGSCPKCADDRGCKVNADCESGVCVPERGYTCLPKQCLDGVRNGSETDTDCGGGACLGCPVGDKCGWTYDCASRACDLLTLQCIADHCVDHAQDVDETDSDCGGPSCAACPLYKRCVLNSDCQTGHTCSVTVPHLCQ